MARNGIPTKKVISQYRYVNRRGKTVIVPSHTRTYHRKGGVPSRPVKGYDKNSQDAFDKAIKRVQRLEQDKLDNPDRYNPESTYPAIINNRKRLEKAHQILRHYDINRRHMRKSYIIDVSEPAYTFKPYTHELAYLTPQEFLDLTPSIEFHSQESLNNLRHRMRMGLPLEPPFLEVEEDSLRVTSHEGRHRAKVAKELGINKIPVILAHKDREGYDTVASEKLDTRFLMKQRSRR